MTENSSQQLREWEGSFGDEYTERNRFDPWKLEPGVEAFRRILGNTRVSSVLEVGSNLGLNLIYINHLFDGQVDLYAVEPNRMAYDALVSQPSLSLTTAWNCDAFHLPLPDSSVDLVFTSGVLIHIAPGDLGRATDEIVRVAREYVLCMEYFSHTPVEMAYRGREGLLFKRDFGAFYLDRYPVLKTVSYGFLWQREFPNFDNIHWWLFKKSDLSKSTGKSS